MPRPVRPWFRFYTETPRDPKVRRLTVPQRWIWTCVIAAARDSHAPGTLFVAENLPMTHQELADFAGVKVREIAPAIAEMTRLGMVHEDGSGALVVTNFQSRQYESDTSTERTRKHRERSKDYGSDDEGTFQQRSSDARSDVPETETETEKNKDTARKRGPSLPKSTDDPVFVEFWGIYPKRIGKADAFKKFVAALRGGVDPQSVINGAKRYAAKVTADRTEERFIANPATWLNQGRWDDEVSERAGNRSVDAARRGVPEGWVS